MNRYFPGLLIVTAACAWLLLAVGNGYSGDSRSSVHTGYYSSDYWYDPYYRSSCCRGGTIVVPPSGSMPSPGLRPPAQLPSRPRPAARPVPQPVAGLRV